MLFLRLRSSPPLRRPSVTSPALPPSTMVDTPPTYSRHKVSQESAPEYPLEDLARGRPRPPLDAAAIEASAPKPRPLRWWQFWKFSRRARIFIGVGALGLVVLVAAMIWLGLHRAKERREHPANLSAARNMVEPEIFTSLVSYDGDLLTPFEFSPPTISNRSFTTSSSTNNATILLSFSQLIQLPTSSSSSSYFVKIFGNRSTDIVFASSPDNSTTDWTAQVSAFWKVAPGGNQEERAQWGVDQLARVVGGSYGYKVDSTEGDSAVGLALKTEGNDTFTQFYSPGSNLDQWLDSTITFTLTILLPPRSHIRRLEIFSTSVGDLNFMDLRNSTFDLVDVRLPLGWMATRSYWPVSTRLLNVFTGQGIVGSYSLTSGTLLSHGNIQTYIAVPAIANFSSSSSSSSPYNLTLTSTSGLISANVTSVPSSNSNSYSCPINLDATTLGTRVEVFFPLDGHSGSYELATNDGRAIAAHARQDGNVTTWLQVGDGQGEQLRGSIVEGGQGKVRLNAASGNVVLSIGPGSFGDD